MNIYSLFNGILILWIFVFTYLYSLLIIIIYFILYKINNFLFKLFYVN